MATEYKLSYTAAEIDERLDKVIRNSEDVSSLQGDVGVIQGDVGSLQTNVDTIQSDVGVLRTDVQKKAEFVQLTSVEFEALGDSVDENVIYGITDDDETGNSVLYTEQSLTDDQKAQVRFNIGAASSANYDESIIGLSVDGTTVTYIKGDGSVHSFETQDTNTEYSLATDEVTGLTKLYATIGNAEDGTMTQKAIKTWLDKKVGVSIDDAQDMLIFTI